MDTENLRTFITLAEHKNFTKTADMLFIAQSTVTNRIAELERETGRLLFWRNKRKVTLTAEGEVFLGYAKRIVELSNTGIQDINALNEYSDVLRIGTTNTIYECHLFPKIRDYMKSYSQNAVKVTIGHSADLIKALQDDLLDVIYAYLPFYKAGYSCELFAVDDLILVTGFHNNRYQEGIAKKELVDSNYLYCNFALQEVGLFIKELFPPHYQFGFEIDNSTKLIPYLMEFDGISFIPESIAAPYIAGAQLRKIRLLDFDSPKINCYKMYKQGNKKGIFGQA